MTDTTDLTDTARPRSSVPVQRILLEAFSIVFAVLVALGVDEWRETRNNEEQARVAYVHIVEEIRSNKTFLTALHTNNVATLTALEDDPTDSKDTSLTFVPGLQLKSSAWETAKGAGVFAHLDYARVLQLSDLYAIQDIYREIGFQLTQAMLQGTAEASVRGEVWDESKVARNFTSWLSLLVSAESSLLSKYDALLETGTEVTVQPD